MTFENYSGGGPSVVATNANVERQVLVVAKTVKESPSAGDFG